MNLEFEEFFKEFEFNEKPEELVYEVNGMTLPDDYLAFMREHNGGELWAYNPDKKTYCQIDSCNIEDDSGDTYMTISSSLEEFLLKMDEEMTD